MTAFEKKYEMNSIIVNIEILHGALLIWLILILSVGNAVEGANCPSKAKPLLLEELNNGNCQSLVNGTLSRYHIMECHVSARYNYHQVSEIRRCLSTWCFYIAKCLNETSDWKTLCSKKFYWFLRSQFDTTSITSTHYFNISYVRNIYVKYCGKTNVNWYTWQLKFSIKMTAHRCETKIAQNGTPSSGQWIGSLSPREKCDKLVNGTNGNWLKVYYTRYDWCKSLWTCFQSSALQRRCLNDFAFYDRFFLYPLYHRAFTFEIGTYLTSTRIQVNYKYVYPYLFGVNVIHCDSAGKYNKSEVESRNDNNNDETDYNLIKEITDEINKLDFQRNDSLQKAVKVFDDVMNAYVNRTTVLGQSLNKTLNQKMEEVFTASLAFEEFVLTFGQYHLINNTVFYVDSGNIVLQLSKGVYKTGSHFHLLEPEGQNYIRIPSDDFSHNGSILLAVIYKNLHQLFVEHQTNTINKTSKSLNTVIMSATIYPPSTKLRRNVTLMFSNVMNATMKRECVFWNLLANSPLGWSGQGCQVKWLNDSKTECTCNHLTHFAVLMQFDTNSGLRNKGTRLLLKKDEMALNILTYLGLTLSLIGIAMTILCYAFLTDIKAPLSQIRISLVASLGVGQTIFLVGIEATEIKGVCVAVAALIQYFLMAAFCWMLIEGVYLYLFVVKVYNVSSKMKICHGFSWGFPCSVVTLSLIIAAGMGGITSFVSEE